mmetsp:Transcript_11575/g.32827  ORF Transcript_11575/g.32827 Transcript_11575/m.32827 type:complete len:215 (+) Transcript_11575:61-705(+)
MSLPSVAAPSLSRASAAQAAAVIKGSMPCIRGQESLMLGCSRVSRVDTCLWSGSSAVLTCFWQSISRLFRDLPVIVSNPITCELPCGLLLLFPPAPLLLTLARGRCGGGRRRLLGGCAARLARLWRGWGRRCRCGSHCRGGRGSGGRSGGGSCRSYCCCCGTGGRGRDWGCSELCSHGLHINCCNCISQGLCIRLHLRLHLLRRGWGGAIGLRL